MCDCIKSDDIPNEEILFRYIKPKSWPEGQTKVNPGFLTDPSLSCDWAKYQHAPEDSIHIKEEKTVIIKINVCEQIRFLNEPTKTQKIYHCPISKEQDEKNLENPSHSLIEGVKKYPVADRILEHTSVYKRVNKTNHK